MTLNELRRATGLNSKEAAARLGLHPVTYWQYKNRKRSAPGWIRRELEKMNTNL
jgi:hypothetical protein